MTDTPIQPCLEARTPKLCRLYVKATPGSKRAAIKGEQLGADGRMRLLVHITAAADKGRANEAVIKLLASTLSLPQSQFQLMTGHTNRLKTFEVAASEADLAPRLSAAVGTAGS